MPDKSSEVDPGFQIKHRIVGALVLITAAIVILPEILAPGSSHPTVSPQPVRPLDPIQESEGFVSRITPLSKGTEPLPTPKLKPIPKSKPKQSAVKSGKQTTSISKEITQVKPVVKATPLKTARLETPKPIGVAKPKTAKKINTTINKTPLPKKVDKPKAKESPSPVPVAVSKPAVIERGWEIRIGTFAQPDNAIRIMAVLHKNGFKPQQKKIKTAKGTVTRVWVGPFATRVTAGRTRASIEAKTKQKGWIAPYP